MIDVPALKTAIGMLFQTDVLMVIPIGVLIGIIIGAAPGLSGAMALSLVLPATFFMPPLPALVLLASVYTGAGFGGGITAILINTPGTPAAVATAMDGYPLTQSGRHNEALGVALAASSMGEFYGTLLLLFAIAPFAWFVVRFGPPEMFLIAAIGLTLIASLSAGNFSRGLFAGAAGFLMGTVGMNHLGYLRGTFGSIYLYEGMPWVPALVGLFCISELYFLMEQDYIIKAEDLRKVDFRNMLKGMAFVFKRPLTTLRAAMIGVIVGAIPGVGGSVANLLAWTDIRNRSKDPDSFGKGNPLGVLAGEAANNSSEAGATATTLVLGIPGGSTAAVLMAGFMLQGLIPGPRLFVENPELIYAYIVANFLQMACLAVVGVFVTHHISRLVTVPNHYLVPLIMSISIVGAFSLRNAFFDTYFLLGFSVLGYFLRKYGYPVAPVVIGMLLGGIADKNLVRTYQMSGGDPSIFVTRPLSLVLLVLLIVLAAAPIVRNWRARRQAAVGKPALS